VSATIRPPAPPAPHEASRYLAAHGRSFWFASALIPEPHRSRVVGVYAYCRYTDDLVDRSEADRAELHGMLDRWLDLSRRAYDGEPTGVPLLRDVMRDMAESQVPFTYVRDLIAGMRMDVEGERYAIRVEEESRYIIRTRGAQGQVPGQVLKAPMPGKVTLIEVAVGQAVAPGDGLIVLEAMKMENEFKAQVAGTVKEIRVAAGQAVNPGDVLLVIE